MKRLIRQVPILGGLAEHLYRQLSGEKPAPLRFVNSGDYWEQRYAAGGTSGVGSYGRFAEFKAEVINRFIAEHDIKSVIEFGCGDGNQLTLARYPAYLGFDVSQAAVSRCSRLFAADGSKSFRLLSDYRGETAEAALSLDVIYHLVEESVFEKYMNRLLGSAGRYVVAYSSNSDDNRGYEGTYIRHRRFTDWIERHHPEWRLLEHIPNRHPYQGDYRQGSFADFFIFERMRDAAAGTSSTS